MPRPSHSFWLDLPNDIWGWVQIMKFLIVQPQLQLHCATSDIIHIKFRNLEYYRRRDFGLCKSSSIFTMGTFRVIWARNVARMWEMRNTYSLYSTLVSETFRRRPFRIPRRIWESNIKMHLMKIWYDDGWWMNLVLDHVQLRSWWWRCWTLQFYCRKRS
jgi:hypothetical protein